MVDAGAEQASSEAAADAGSVDTGFGAEFRELARQRRFVRSDEAAASGSRDWRSSVAGTAGADRTDWRAAAATPAAPTPAPARRAAPLPATPPPTPAAPAAPAAAALPAAAPAQPARRASRRITDDRITQDQRATLLELARMSDRLVESREQLATVTARTQHLEHELAGARDEVAATEQRLMASRLLVQDAQRAAHQVAERCAWLEARCETLQEALELAVNASWMTRWKWRREQRARARG